MGGNTYTGLAKHEKYHKMYIPNDIFWGLGVEHEVYIETSRKKRIPIEELATKTKRERYSVDYLAVYKPGVYADAIAKLIARFTSLNVKSVHVPILLNAHSFTNCDARGEHKTLYTSKVPAPINPMFNGKTLFDDILAKSGTLASAYENEFLFDGDTIEFTTLNFRNATIDGVICELREQEDRFIGELNKVAEAAAPTSVLKYGPFKIARDNYAFASYMTNLNHNAMFNNGTIHINITLPTELDEKGHIRDMVTFTAAHKRLARIIQWFEPFIIAVYCTRDPLSNLNLRCLPSKASQRLAVSRYIGIGTYDTEQMLPGKILKVPKEGLWPAGVKSWYDMYEEDSAYMQLDDVGMDINFNKHYNHGLELRFLDSMPIETLRCVLEDICLIANYSTSTQHDISDPRISGVWHGIVNGIMRYGSGGYILSDEECAKIQREIGCGGGVRSATMKGDLLCTRNIEGMYLSILNEYNKLYGRRGSMTCAFGTGIENVRRLSTTANKGSVKNIEVTGCCGISSIWSKNSAAK